DLDVLVPPDRALAAFQALSDGGCVRAASQHWWNPEDCLRTRRHLPPLRTPSGSVHLELHSRLYLPRQAGGEEDPALWRRLVRKTVAGHDLAFLCPADLLLHLIVHAAYDHHFDNGPLLLTDIEGLLREPSLDWPLFWELAEAGGWIRGCLLVLAMVERHFPDATIPYPAALLAERQRVPADLLAATASLTLGLSGARSDLRLVAGMKRAATMRDKLKPLRDSVFPSKRMIATMYPVREDSAAVYLWYLVKWGRMAMISLPRFLATRQKARATLEIDQGARLVAWLDGG
ncbi:MAG: nucleotidyltransferase family protein, partial [Alphaproteobacteria bacterium]|nr:nucleotidyltransferase family protein [Alphaproteobacteria bacterium]